MAIPADHVFNKLPRAFVKGKKVVIYEANGGVTNTTVEALMNKPLEDEDSIECERDDEDMEADDDCSGYIYSEEDRFFEC
jgi:hypothetical protein